MGDVARPMLAEVLAVVAERSAWAEHLSAWLRSDLARREHLYPGAWLDLDADEVCLRRRVSSKELPLGDKRDVELLGWAPWTITSPAEAQETLVSRGLLPEGWCQDVQRGWAEEIRNTLPGALFEKLIVERPAPSTIPDLLALASLGWPVIHRAEELAREACHTLREYGCPQPDRVVWRVGHPQPAKEVLVVLCPWEKNNETSTWVGVDGVLHDTRWYCGAPKSKLTIGPASSLWDSGLALDAITADAVRIVVPPVGGGRG